MISHFFTRPFFNPVSLKNQHRMFFFFKEIKKILA